MQSFSALHPFRLLELTRLVVHVKRKIGHPVKDRFATIDLDRLQDVLMMAENDVGARIDSRMPILQLVCRKLRFLEMQAPVH